MKVLTNEELAQLLDKDIFHKISQAADNLGCECYVVGGYVRDLFLERPSEDIDVVDEVTTYLFLRISEQHKSNITIRRLSLSEHVRRVTATTPGNRLSRTEPSKMIKTDVTLPSMPLLFASTRNGSVNLSIHSTVSLTSKTVSSAHLSTRISHSLMIRCV